MARKEAVLSEKYKSDLTYIEIMVGRPRTVKPRTCNTCGIECSGKQCKNCFGKKGLNNAKRNNQNHRRRPHKYL